MRKEVTHLAIRLEKLKKIYEENKCVQCYILLQYFKREYNHIKEDFKLLENLAESNSNIQEFQIVELRQILALLGLYIMV